MMASVGGLRSDDRAVHFLLDSEWLRCRFGCDSGRPADLRFREKRSGRWTLTVVCEVCGWRSWRYVTPIQGGGPDDGAV